MPADLFSPLTIRGVTLRNRIGVSPMCQYSSEDGRAGDWHLVHLGGFAKGGAGLVVTESTAVVPEGRLSPFDLGLWDDRQIEPLRRITSFITGQGAVAAIQLGHGGRKAAAPPPWARGGTLPAAQGGWPVVGPSALAFERGWATPASLDAEEILRIPGMFATAAVRAVEAGYQVVEVHAAHGYLLHQFLSPLSNQREDAWGGSFEHRARLTVEVVSAVRAAVGEDVPVFVRISATDWHERGWTVQDSIRLAMLLQDAGSDLIDTSTGGNVASSRIPVGPGYQIGFAQAIRHEAGVRTAAVGLIEEPLDADAVIRDGKADLVMLGRAMLRDPAWAHKAAAALGADSNYPIQYGWAIDHAAAR